MPKVTKEQIDALIARSTTHAIKIGAKTTVVCLTLPNGFEVIESSACVDPSNYSHELGITICMRRLVDKLFMLEGYALQCGVEGALIVGDWKTDGGKFGPITLARREDQNDQRQLITPEMRAAAGVRPVAPELVATDADDTGHHDAVPR